MGSLISQRQLDRVLAHVDDAVRPGRTLLTGGQRPAGRRTVLLRADGPRRRHRRHDPLRRGDVRPRRRDLPGRVRRGGDPAAPTTPPTGSTPSVVTRDTAMGRTIARPAERGHRQRQRGATARRGAALARPMGGMGDSGLGRRHGDEGLLKYTESQTIATQRLLGFGPPFGWTRREVAEHAGARARGHEEARAEVGCNTWLPSISTS